MNETEKALFDARAVLLAHMELLALMLRHSVAPGPEQVAQFARTQSAAEVYLALPKAA